MRETDFCSARSPSKLTAAIGAVAAAAVMFSAACGDATRTDDLNTVQTLPTNTATQAIKGGEVDETHTAIVGLAIQRGGGAGICSGTLIGENVVLTAQHCVSELSDDRGVRCGSTTFTGQLPTSAISVTTDTNLRQTSNFMGVEAIHTPPGGDEVCGNDLAILQLDTSVPRSTAEPRRPRIHDRVDRSTTYTAIGYGATSNTSGGGSGTRRQIGGRSVRCVGSSCVGSHVVDSEFRGDGGACRGDSGGGALDQQGRVIGAASRAGGNCDSTMYAGVYKWKDWVRQTTTQAANDGGASPPEWANPGPDGDDDGISDKYDNCPNAPNKDQVDTDDDGEGDACDNDSDEDGVPDSEDNCQTVINPNQGDADDDGQGDACDDDSDDDGINDKFDNCPVTPNPDQTTTNANGDGDACDPDDDGDGIEDDNDNCPKTANPDQTDSDGDGLGDACDDMPHEEGAENDRDADGIKDDVDNCPDAKNRGQTDADGDGDGGACDDTPNCNTDIDADCDGVDDDNDNCPEIENPDQTDSEDDGTGDACAGSDEVILIPNEEDGAGHACSASTTGSTSPADLGGSFLLMLLVVGSARMRLRRD